jgi:hypothetical protein
MLGVLFIEETYCVESQFTVCICVHVRFLNDPLKDTGYVGCALTSNMVRFFKTADGSWSHEVGPFVHAKVLSHIIDLIFNFNLLTLPICHTCRLLYRQTSL